MANNEKGIGFNLFSSDGDLWLESIEQVQKFVEMNHGSHRWFKDAKTFDTRFGNRVVYGGRYFVFSIKDGAEYPNPSFRIYSVAEVTDTGYIQKLTPYYGIRAGNASAAYYAKKEAAANAKFRVEQIKKRKAAQDES